MSDQLNNLPASIDAERGVLGAILLNNDLGQELAGLSTDDFFLDSHRKIFNRMLDLIESKAPVDQVTLFDLLNSHGEIAAVGGINYVAGLTDRVPRRTSIAHYVRVLRDKAIARSLVHLSTLMDSEARGGSRSVPELLTDVQERLLKLSLQSLETESDVFIDAADFCQGKAEDPDWVVEGLIVRGSNGLACADPKGAKSMTFGANLSVCLALGLPWLGLHTKRMRVALVSREDNPETTKRRIQQVVAGKGGHTDELRGWLHVNTKKQTPSLMLDNAREVNNLIRCLKKWGSEFLIFDVFNKLHTQDENDNTAVRMVMNQIDRILAETGAQACVLHHWNKGDVNQSLTKRARGAGAIAGFAEWIAGIEMVDEATQTRRMSFETKEGSGLAPLHYQIVDEKLASAVEFHVVEPSLEETQKPRGRRT